MIHSSGHKRMNIMTKILAQLSGPAEKWFLLEKMVVCTKAYQNN
jgi:hypothetical protein